MHHPTDRIAHTTAFVTPVVEHWLEWEIVQRIHPMKDRSDNPSHYERMLLPRSYISLWVHHEGSIRRPIALWANALTTELHLAPGPPWGINPMTHRTMSECSYHGATSRSGSTMRDLIQRPHRTMSEHSYHGATSRSGSTMRDRSDDPSHYELADNRKAMDCEQLQCPKIPRWVKNRTPEDVKARERKRQALLICNQNTVSCLNAPYIVQLLLWIIQTTLQMRFQQFS